MTARFLANMSQTAALCNNQCTRWMKKVLLYSCWKFLPAGTELFQYHKYLNPNWIWKTPVIYPSMEVFIQAMKQWRISPPRTHLIDIPCHQYLSDLDTCCCLDWEKDVGVNILSFRTHLIKTFRMYLILPRVILKPAAVVSYLPRAPCSMWGWASITWWSCVCWVSPSRPSSRSRGTPPSSWSRCS